MLDCVKQKTKKLVALVGSSAVGKSTVERILQDLFGYKRCISTTTRPKRDYEVDGVDYYFVSDEEFHEMIEEGLLAESTCFNSWNYGLSIAEIEDGDIVVVEPNGLQQIINNIGRENVFVVYLTLSDKDRLIRSLVNRGDNDVDEVIRRYQADKRDMQGMVDNSDITIVNHDSNRTAKIIDSIIKTLEG